MPRTDVLLTDPRLVSARYRLGADVVRDAVRTAQQAVRSGQAGPDAAADLAVAALPASATSLQPVLNATGVLVHTNLGRAPLSPAAREALLAAAGTTDVELDLATGRRGRRGAGALGALAAAVPAARGVHVVNNNAAALVLAVTALAQGREVLVSRGELVEIGDGFRLPDLLSSTGARLREVGTTNRTTLRDYADAGGPDTALVIKVHPSNFVVRGFTADVPVAELATLGLPVLHDIGSGLLQAHPRLPGEPDAASSLRDGAALVTASADKLLGGPQAGLLLGDEDLVRRCRRHPLARALRVDKLTLAALEATLRGPATPVRRALDADPADLAARAVLLAERLREAGIEAMAVPTQSVVGGGGAPGVELASSAVAVPAALAEPLRRGADAVLGRVEHDRLLLDVRTVDPNDDDRLAAAVQRAATSG